MKCKILYAFLCLLTATTANAQVYEKSKSETRTFPATASCTVQISNKYGDIQVIPGESDSVKFIVEVKVTNKKEADAEKKLEAISVNFTSNPFLISATTVFRDSPGQWQAELNDLAKSVFNPTNKAEINMYVYMPATVGLKIDNKYGNVFLSDHSGSVDITLSNGDLKAGSISNDASFRFSFVKATVTQTTHLNADMNYSELTLKKTGNARISSRSSKYWITSLQKLDLDSRNDKFAIDTVSVVSGKTSFSGLTLGLLYESMLLTSMYGDLNISDLVPGFKFINLNTEFTDVILILQNEASCKLFADYRKTKVNVTPGIGTLETQITDAEKQQSVMSGVIGSDTNSTSTLQINAISGSLTLLKR